jgi:hypothetical protein
MTPALLRSLGFLPPTLLAVVVLHLDREVTAGAALDGFLSALWFTGAFLAGSSVRLAWASPQIRRGGGWMRSILEGLVAAMIAWALLWMFWAVPLPGSLPKLREWAFLLNSASIALAGLATGRASRSASRMATRFPLAS